MKKNSIDGMKDSVRRSIRDIPMPSNHTAVLKKNIRKRSAKTETNPSEYRPRDFSKVTLWSIAAISIIVLGFAISSFFKGATIVITPKQQSVTLDNSFIIKTGTATSSSYTSAHVSDSVTYTTEASTEQYVEEKSTGTIIVYNTHSSSPQTLITQTRFESPEGLIYRIQEEIIVPGQKEINGEIVPGQIEVIVVADEAGEKYNMGLTDFTIPGFEGDARYETFFARSKTNMSGGVKGLQKYVSPEDKDTISSSLRGKLQEKLLTDLQARLGTEKVIPQNGTTFLFDSMQQEDVTESEVLFTQSGTLTAIVIDRVQLESFVAKPASLNNTVPVEITNISDLDIYLPEDTDLTVDDTDLSVRVVGDAHLVWSFDTNAVVDNLLGQPKNNLSKMLSIYEGIEKATATIYPFWSRTFPYEKDEISVEKVLD